MPGLWLSLSALSRRCVRFGERETIRVCWPAILPAGPSLFQRERLLDNGYRSFALEDYTSVPGQLPTFALPTNRSFKGPVDS